MIKEPTAACTPGKDGLEGRAECTHKIQPRIAEGVSVTAGLWIGPHDTGPRRPPVTCLCQNGLICSVGKSGVSQGRDTRAMR
jgi:hypothetical protein